MPYSGTPEEQKAKAHARYLRTRHLLIPKQKARDVARIAAMTPEEFAAFRDRQRAAVKRYETKHRAKRRARKKTPAFRSRSAAWMRKKRHANIELTRVLARAYYAKDPQRAIAATLKWAKKNPAKVQANCERRRARIAGAAINDVTPAQRELVIATANGRCAYCPHYNPTCQLCARGTHTDLTVDHITAIVNGGDNTLHNLVACCASCN